MLRSGGHPELPHPDENWDVSIDRFFGTQDARQKLGVITVINPGGLAEPY